MIRRGVLTIVTMLGVLGTFGVLNAAEQKCTDLAVNCVCSEPSNTANLGRVSPAWYNPADSTSKECNTEGPGLAIVRNADDLIASNDATVLGALPGGHQVQYFVRGPEGHAGSFFAGHTFGSQFVKRAAVRFYLYHSPNFQWSGEGACENSKLAEFDDALLDKSFGFVHMYNFLDWTPAQDCCLSGPGADNVTKDDWRGNWWRVEIVFTNRAGGNPGFVAKVYMRNVTDNGRELTVVDSSLPGTQLIQSSTRTPPQRQDKMWMNNYRQGTCNGWLGFSHVMAAGWDTDQGQRIGPAYEIEGPRSSPPTKLRIRQPSAERQPDPLLGTPALRQMLVFGKRVRTLSSNGDVHHESYSLLSGAMRPAGTHGIGSLGYPGTIPQPIQDFPSHTSPRWETPALP